VLPGPTYIKQCPECSCHIRQTSLISGNTIGAIYWTDGKMEAPHLPSQPDVVRCPDCDSLFWLSDIAPTDTVDPTRIRSRTLSFLPEIVKSPVAPTFQMLVDYLSTTDISSNRERYARQYAWCCGNDSRRETASVHKSAMSSAEILNLRHLEILLDPTTDNDRIRIAEIRREMSDFDGALALLSSSSNDRKWWMWPRKVLSDCPTANVIKELALKGNALVARV